MLKLIILSLVAILTLGGCSVADFGVDKRQEAMEDVGEFWCGLSAEEQESVAEVREYSEAFQDYLDTYCTEETESTGETALATASLPAVWIVRDSPGSTLLLAENASHRPNLSV